MAGILSEREPHFKFRHLSFHSKLIMFRKALYLCIVNTGKAEGHKAAHLIYLEGYLVSHLRLGHYPVFLFHSNYKGGSLHIYVASRWSLTQASYSPTCDTPYKAA